MLAIIIVIILHYATCQGYPAGKKLRQGQNPGLSESCCPPPFPYTTLPPTSQKGHFILFCSLVIYRSANTDSPWAGPTSDSCLPFPSPNAHREKVLEERHQTPCQEVWQGCGQLKQALMSHQRPAATCWQECPTARGLDLGLGPDPPE